MILWHRLWSFLRSLGRRPEREGELSEELAFYLDQAVERHRERGLSPGEARRAALREVGGAEQVKETVREVWAGALVDSVLRDLRYGLRALRRNPGFTLVSVLTLALGIGANTAIFSLVHAVLLRPLPYEEPDRLAMIWPRFDGAGQSRNPASAAELLDLRERSTLFQDFGGIWATAGALTGDGDPEQVRMGFVTGNFFDVLGARPALGRAFEAGEEGRQGSGAIILSDGLWRRRYAADPEILGRPVQYAGHAVTVVGVLPAEFELLFPADSSVPSDLQAYIPFPWTLSSMPRDLSFIRVLGRMKDGVTVAQAREEIEAIAAQLRDEHTRYVEVEFGMDVAPLQADVVRDVRPALLALFGGVGLVLLIACVNVANLQLGRMGARSHELSLRRALGASRGRLIRQLLVESLLLALLGGAAGLALGRAGLGALMALRPDGLERLAGAPLSVPVLLFTLGASVLAGVLACLAPMLRTSASAVMDALKDGGRAGATAPRERLRRMLVVAEVALGFVLLIGAGLMMRTLERVGAVDPGFRPDGALTFQVSLPDTRYGDDAARARLARRFEEGLAALPGVESAGAISHLPLDDYPNWYGFYYTDGAADEDRRSVMADHRAVTPGYFDAIGARLIRGRGFDAHDEAGGRPVVVVDESLAARTWPGENPLGKGLHLGVYQEGDFVAGRAEVVGVVGHIRHHSLTESVRGQIYIPHPQSARPVLTFVVRTAGDPRALVGPVRDLLAGHDKDLPLSRVHTLDDYFHDATAATRFTAVLAAVFGGSALLLAAVGLYGVISYSVSRRTQEIGVRMALGARAPQILGLVVGEGLRAALLGLGLGLAGALLLAGSLETLLFDVRPTDPLTYAGVSALLVVVAVLASCIPAGRASRIDPMRSLRCE